MRKINKDKKAVSLMLSYVLLVLIALAVGTLIYFWMKDVIFSPGETCPEGVSLIIRDVSCSGGQITITIANKGTFNVHGIIVRGSDDPEIAPIINLKSIDSKITVAETLNMFTDVSGNSDPLEPNEEGEYTFDYSTVLPGPPVKITIGAIRTQEEETLVCERTFITRNVDC